MAVAAAERAEAPADETDRLIFALESARAWFEPKPPQTSRVDAALAACVLLAPSIAVCEALMRREKVPVSRLDPRWAKAYGLIP